MDLAAAGMPAVDGAILYLQLTHLGCIASAVPLWSTVNRHEHLVFIKMPLKPDVTFTIGKLNTTK